MSSNSMLKKIDEVARKVFRHKVSTSISEVSVSDNFYNAADINDIIKLNEQYNNINVTDITLRRYFLYSNKTTISQYLKTAEECYACEIKETRRTYSGVRMNNTIRKRALNQYRNKIEELFKLKAPSLRENFISFIKQGDDVYRVARFSESCAEKCHLFIFSYQDRYYAIREPINPDLLKSLNIDFYQGLISNTLPSTSYFCRYQNEIVQFILVNEVLKYFSVDLVQEVILSVFHLKPKVVVKFKLERNRVMDIFNDMRASLPGDAYVDSVVSDIDFLKLDREGQ